MMKLLVLLALICPTLAHGYIAERIERAYITDDGTTCTIASQSGSWLTSAVHGSSICTLTIATGMFSSAPACTVSVAQPANVLARINAAITTTTIITQFIVPNTLGGADANHTIICMGPR